MNPADPIEIFRVEAQELLEQIEQGLLDLEGDPSNPELVASVFRALHTLKGSGAMFGFDALAAFVHHCESAFDRVRKGEVMATPALIRAVLGALDHMRALAEGGDAPAAVGEALLVRLHEVVDGGAVEVQAPAAPVARTWRIRFSLPKDALVNGTRPLVLLDELRELGECTVVALTDDIAELEALQPTECRLAWDVILTMTHPASAIDEVFMFVLDDMSLQVEAIEPEAPAEVGASALAPILVSSMAELEPPPATADRAAGPQSPAATSKALETLRVPALRLDELMDRVGELVIAQSRLKQVASASVDMTLRSVSEEIERLAAELRDTMMSVRMVPIGQLFGRFRRLVHDLATETGKTIEFCTEGEATELDKTIIERLADPLVHVIRNSADHGLEPSAQRLAAGKPAAGRLVLSARQEGAEVVITITDDGRGVDRERVRAKAEEAGLLAPGAVVSDADLLKIIFQPGFSTASQVTSLSGRGVGMDVVKRTIEGLRGTIEITSKPGEGSQVALRIPLTLAIIDGLLVRVGAGRYVIPLSSVEECVELSPAQDVRSTGRSLITLRDQLVPFLRLREAFAVSTAVEPYQKIVVVSAGGARIGLVVDQILGDHQTVIKPLSHMHADVAAFSGATILGDGGVALILDVAHFTAGQSQPAPLRAAS